MANPTLPGEQWIPSNSSDGDAMFCSYCRHCARDRAMREGMDVDDCDDDELCDVLARSFRGEAVEWRILPTGRITCTAYIPAGQPIPQRCPATADMWPITSAGAADAS